MSQTLAVDWSTGLVAQPLRYAVGVEAVVTRCFLRLYRVRGTDPGDGAAGLPWLDWAQRPAVPRVEIEAAVRTQLRRVAGVVGVVSVTASRVGGSIVVQAVVDCDADGRTQAATLGVPDPLATAGPSPWYAVSGAARAGRVLGG